MPSYKNRLVHGILFEVDNMDKSLLRKSRPF